MKVVAPSNPADAYGLMLSLHLRRRPVPVHREHADLLESGRAAGRRVSGSRSARRTSLRAGRDVTVVSYSRTVADCAAVADKLAKERRRVSELIDLRTIAPYDADTVLSSVARTRRAVIVHEAVRPFGVGAEIAARINEELFGQLHSRVERVGAPFFAGAVLQDARKRVSYRHRPDIEAAIRSTLRPRRESHHEHRSPVAQDRLLDERGRG